MKNFHASTQNVTEHPSSLANILHLFCLLLPHHLHPMKQTNEYIDLIKAHSEELRTQFGVRQLRLFGSVSRGEQHEGSDVDVCVDMAPRIYLVSRLQRYLEQLLGCNVDVIRKHKHMNPYLLQNIENDGIYVFGEA